MSIFHLLFLQVILPYTIILYPTSFCSIRIGLIAGASGVIIGHPLDTIKVHYQISTKAKTLNTNLRYLYRGILPPLLTSGSIQSINFSLYEYFKDQLRSYHYLSHSPIIFLSGAGSGAIISLLATPIGNVKIRQQTSRLSQESPTIRQVVAHIYTSHGIRGFYKAYGPMLFMESFGRGFYLYVYDSMKRQLTQRSGVEETLSIKIASGATAGVSSWLLVYPLDVVKARLQVDAGNVKYQGVLDCVIKTWREGGVRAFTRGLGFTLLRAAPVAAVILPIYETSKDALERLMLPAVASR